MTTQGERFETVTVSLETGMHFVGETDDGHRVHLDADSSLGGAGAGLQPLRLLLLGVAGCTAMDVISILRKKRQRVHGLEVEVRGERVEEHLRVYGRVEILYRVRGSEVDRGAVERAIQLSETRYCPAIAMIGASTEITSSYSIGD